MNLEKLKLAEANFLDRYPGGFQHPEIEDLSKKHKMDKLIQKAQEVLHKDKFDKISLITENIIKTVTSSSMVSVFEKPKFRDFVKTMNPAESARIVSAVYQLLHDDMQKGFEALLHILIPAKQAKWTLMTVLPAYFRPNEEVFIKPTTVKNVITYFEIPDLIYKARPTWEFYIRYRKTLIQMKNNVSDLLSPNNAAFSGFLMMAMEM